MYAYKERGGLFNIKGFEHLLTKRETLLRSNDPNPRDPIYNSLLIKKILKKLCDVTLV